MAATAFPTERATQAIDQRGYRLTSIDMVRGLVIVIMAIDHVRDNFFAGAQQDPMADPNIAVSLFATRWITHFCAPVFVLLAGVSAGLMATRRTPGDLGRFLLTRGLWLIVVECIIISTSATFAPRGIPELEGRTLVIMQVIWAIGASMVALSAAQWLGRRACLIIGVAIVAGHNLLDPWWPMSAMLDQQWPLWVALHGQMSVAIGPFLVVFAYPVVAWIGVMLVGFGISPAFELPARERNAALLRAGVTLTVGFIVLRTIGVYGDPNGWQAQAGGVTRTVLDFLNTTKYPPSLDFLLMTLGPAAIVCSLADRVTGRVKDTLVMFGRVPFAFYVAHFYLIHVLSIALGLLQGFTLNQMSTLFFFYPQGYGLTLPGVYAMWALIILLLYPFCRWVSVAKARRRDWWLSYV
jgi:uncharacterized membrane protein